MLEKRTATNLRMFLTAFCHAAATKSRLSNDAQQASSPPSKGEGKLRLLTDANYLFSTPLDRPVSPPFLFILVLEAERLF